MLPFTFYSPTKIVFGEDTAYGVGDILKELGGSRPFVVSDANLVAAGVLRAVLESLKEAGLGDPVIFDQVPPDSDLDCVRSASALARQHGCDCIVAVGGGSVIDTGKAANISLVLDGDIRDFEGMHAVPRALAPLVVLPTTAGTGSEVSAVAMVKNKDEHTKLAFGSYYLFPSVAVLDPKLLMSLPPKLTAATGMDALTHAIECFCATTTNPASDALCLESMRMIFQDLCRATMHGDDLDARSSTLIASTMAGIAFTNGGVGIVHALAHTVGARYDTHHGVTNAIFLPYGMIFNMAACAHRFAFAFRSLCAALRAAPEPVGHWFAGASQHDSQAAEQLIEAVRQLHRACRLPTRLRDIGVPALSQDEISELAVVASTDSAIMFNVREASVEDLEYILKGAW